MISRVRKLYIIAVTLAMAGVTGVSGANDGWYAGVGLSPGLTHMEPDTSDTPYSLRGEFDSGYKLYLGYDLSGRLSVEAYYSDLGRVSISPSGSIGYRDIGVDGVYYLMRPEGSREGASLFARAGAGRMYNDTSLPYERSNDWHLMLGLGGEYGLGDGWALRADLDLYDIDAQMFSIGVMKRFGARAEPVAVVEPDPQPAPQPVVVENPDRDGDGILNASDACPGTPPGTKVDERGCELQEVIVLEGVTFASNSAELIGESATILNGVATTLKRYPEKLVEVAGYTDSRGGATYNQQLSERRANAVRDYLIGQGVSAERLTARGYGEESPLADNDTAEGRAKNRRVELHLSE